MNFHTLHIHGTLGGDRRSVGGGGWESGRGKRDGGVGLGDRGGEKVQWAQPSMSDMSRQLIRMVATSNIRSIASTAQHRTHDC